MELLALTEGERVAIIAGMLAICAGVPGAVAAVITARTRKENADQHGSSQAKLEEVRDAVSQSGAQVAELRYDVQTLGGKVDSHSELLARHDERLRSHDTTLRANTAPSTQDPEDSHPVL